MMIFFVASLVKFLFTSLIVFTVLRSSSTVPDVLAQKDTRTIRTGKALDKSLTYIFEAESIDALSIILSIPFRADNRSQKTGFSTVPVSLSIEEGAIPSFRTGLTSKLITRRTLKGSTRLPSRATVQADVRVLLEFPFPPPSFLTEEELGAIPLTGSRNAILTVLIVSVLVVSSVEATLFCTAVVSSERTSL